MEGGRQHAALLDEHGLAAMAAQDLDGRAERAESRSADEEGSETAAERRGVDAGLEGLGLAAPGVSLDRDVEEAQARLRGRHLAGQQDRASTGAEERAAARVESAERLEPGLVAHEVEQ